jgi:hypothetical protein
VETTYQVISLLVARRPQGDLGRKGKPMRILITDFLHSVFLFIHAATSETPHFEQEGAMQ